jgi:hypothetical protein
LNQYLYVDDTALVANEEYKLQELVTEFGRVCGWRKLSVKIVANCKVIIVT